MAVSGCVTAMSKRRGFPLAVASMLMSGFIVGAGVSPAGAAALPSAATPTNSTSVPPAAAPSPHWTLLPNTVAKAPLDAATGVSCTTAASCLAVTGTGHALRWNGTSWSDASPTGLPTESSLTGVSCASATFCVATVNEFTASGPVSALLRWSGSGWSAMPNPSGAVPNYLRAVSCPTATFCVAIGYSYAGVAIAATWNGSSWTGKTITSAGTSLFNKSVQMTGVSCVSSTACVAVGNSKLTIIPNPRYPLTTMKPFATSFDGTNWTVSPAPANPGQATLSGVSCWAAKSCAIVGTGFRASSLFTFVNGVWKQPAHPGSTTPSAQAVSCLDATHCVAAGAAGSSGNVHRWTGQTWRGESAGITGLVGISCVAGNACTAVGSAVAEQGTGTWVQRRLPVQQAAAVANLESVSCGGGDDCMAVGSQSIQGAAGGDSSVVASGNATAWSTATIGPPLISLDCPDSTQCFAIGSGGVVTHTAAGWSSLLGSPQLLAGLSCVTTTSCVTISYPMHDLFGSGFHDAVYRWNGSRWTTLAPVRSASGVTVNVKQLSCPTTTFCLAVGQQTGPADGSADPRIPFAATWNGTTWTERAVPGAAATQSWLTGVSCRAATDCLAVGTSGSDHALIEHWTGTAFVPMAVPASAPPLMAVSCRNASACVALSQVDSRSVLWNGAGWTILPTVPSPLGGATWLESVDCTPDACFGVGVAQDADALRQEPVVQRLS
jgi:hypothetical protein